MISWRLFSSATPMVRPIAGRFGSMASMPRAPSAMVAAISTTNSTKPAPPRAGLWRLDPMAGAKAHGGAGVEAETCA